MPNLNRRFSSGRMNKDLDERLVPNGEYRDALNIEVATSDTSDMGTVQTVMGNLNMSLTTIDPNNIGDFYCVGSVVNEQHDKIYWMLAGRTSDIIAEYDYKTQTTTPVVVDLFQAGTIPGNESGRVLNFDRAFIITGINIIENMLFWTDNYSEPKRIHIDRCKLGTPDFTSQTQLFVRDISTNNASIDYYAKGDLKHEHITVIKKSPSAPPVLEMRNKLRVDQNPYGTNFASDFLIGINGNFTTDPGNPFFDSGGDPIESLLVTFNTTGFFNQFPDFVIGDIINIYVGVDEAEDNNKFVRAEILSYDVNTGAATLKVLSGTKTIISTSGEWYVELEQAEPLFQFKFPRFGIRYKYEDGEYSSFSPFSQVAFLPQDFDYLPKEGYNLGMVNNLRFLAIRDFVHGQSIPDDVISIDILYKESNSPNIYTVKTIKRLENDWVPGFEPWSSSILSLDDVTANYSEWNAIGPKDTVGAANGLVPGQLTRGWTRITSEMIHAVLPSNQLLRPYDNVPRVALAQEVVGNRLVYGNYLQNYNMFNRFAVHTKALEYFNEFNYGELDPESQISVDIKASLSSKSAGEAGQLLPEQSNPFYSYFNVYLPAKSIKTLRTYQLGVAYIDEYGRETPVFSNSTIDKASLYVEKIVADKKNRLQAQLFNTHPEWAKSFKFFVKETSNEYYNLAMDRWYDAEDGNIWISFPSSERNKIDEETFLILKKEHDNNNFVSSPARYKVIAIENEAPTFVKTSTLQQPTFTDTGTTPGPFDIGNGATGFPVAGGDTINLASPALTSSGWETALNLSTPPNPNEAVVIRDYDIRITGTQGGVNFSSDWYRLKGIAVSGTDHVFTIFKEFGNDVNVLSPTGTFAGYTGGGKIELRKRVVDNKPEFDGRFFVKIRRDAELENTIIKPVASSINWQINNSMQVQYINPDSDFSKGPDQNWFGVWNQTTTPEQAISLADNSSANNPGTHVSFQATGGGFGQDYWELASHNTDSATAESSGWFIDKIEGFRRFPTTQHYFGQTNSDAWLTKAQHGDHASGGGAAGFYFYWGASGYNWNGSPSNINLNARNRHDMPVVMGTATHSSSDTGSYLNLNHSQGIFNVIGDANVNGPSYIGNGLPITTPGTNWVDSTFSDALEVGGQGSGGRKMNSEAIVNNIDGFADNINQSVLRTGLNGYLQHVGDTFGFGTVGALPGNGGGVLPSLGIDGHPDAGGPNPDHTGLIKGVNSYQGTNIITISHAGIGGDEEDVDGQGADAPSQGTSVSDLVLAFAFGATQTGYTVKHVNDIAFINALRTPGTAWRWAEDPGQVVYKTIDPNTVDLSGWGITSSEISVNFTGADPLDGEPGIGLYNYCSLGDWADSFMMYEDGGASSNTYTRAAMVSQGAGSMASQSDAVYVATNTGLGTIGQPQWKYSDAFTNPGADPVNRYQDVAESNTCGGWSIGPAPLSINTLLAPTAAHGMWPMYVKDWWKSKNRRRRFMIVAESYDGGLGLGETSPHNYLPTNDPTLDPHFDAGQEVKTGANIPGTPAPGIRSDGVYSGYSIGGDVVPFGPTIDGTAGNLKYPGSVTWQILSPYVDTDSEKYSSTNPAIFETEPKENVDLNIYYEVGQIYPIELNEKTGEQFVGPIHPSIPLAPLNSKVTCYDPNPVTNPNGNFRGIQTGGAIFGLGAAADIRVESLQDNVLTLCDVDGGKLNTDLNPTATLPEPGDRLIFSRADGGKTETTVLGVNATTGEFVLDRALHNYKVTLPWHNCYSFGNGVESDRIRDDFNQVTIDNGPKASATLEEPYEEERRGSGLIYSGIYNSMSGVNNLNQFIQAEKITKDLNPVYGTIQKLHTRDTNLVTLCEDKIFKILANKDALFNADGNSNVTATSRVLGATTPFMGDFGISQNPESFVAESYRAYFTDKVRGQVLRLSQDGITPISDAGMGDWFSDNLKLANRLIGSYDEKKDEYNLTLDHKEYPLAQPLQVIDNFLVEIEAFTPDAPPGIIADYEVTGNILAPITVGITTGMVLNGPGLATNTIVTSVTPNGNQLILTVNPTPTTADVSPLLGPATANQFARWFTHVGLGIFPEPVSNYSNISGNYDLTVSFSERAKGWTSFKSFAQESGVSLNNTYYTFKGGHIHEHHVESQPRNNFYGDQYDSSIEVLFNEAPDAVKSFNTLNYEGTQSRITPDLRNSGEYWDNYLHTGWYVSNMLTNLQEGGMQEFKEKEGKWFSQIKGVTTEWLDDGKAGNIDTREFSYQGIDEADAIDITYGGYTSYNCVEVYHRADPVSACTTDLAIDLNGNEYVYINAQTAADLSAATNTPVAQTPAWINYVMLNHNVPAGAPTYTSIGIYSPNFALPSGGNPATGFVRTDYNPFISMNPPLSQDPCYVNGVNNDQGHYTTYYSGFNSQDGPAPHIYAVTNYLHAILPAGLQHSNGMDVIQAMENKLLVWEIEYDINGDSIFPPDVESLKDIAIAAGVDLTFPPLDGRIDANGCNCPVISWSSNYFCEEVNGQGGEYSTLSACESVCGLSAETYECVNGSCIDPGDGSGSYTTYCDCVNNSLCCDEGAAYAYDCQNITPPSPIIYGCMDDGVTTDPYIIRNRPSSWVGAASNYYPQANAPDCSCNYSTPPTPVTVDCSGPNGTTYNGQYIQPYTCYFNTDGTGQYTDASASATGFPNPIAQCNSDCQAQQCIPGNYYSVDAINITNTTTNDNCVTGQIGVALSNMVNDVVVEIQDLSGVVIASQTLIAPAASYIFANLADGDYNVNMYDVVDNCGDFYSVSISCAQSPSCDEQSFGAQVITTQNFFANDCSDNQTILQDGMLELIVPNNGYGQQSGTYTITSIEALYINQSGFTASNNITQFVTVNNSPIANYTANIGTVGVQLSGIQFTLNQGNSIASFPNGYEFLITIQDSNGCNLTLTAVIPCDQPPPPQPSAYDCVNIGSSGFQCVAASGGYFTNALATANGWASPQLMCQYYVSQNLSPCQSINPPDPDEPTGCMDDGTPANYAPNRPSNWTGPASNYDPNATIAGPCIYATIGENGGGSGDPGGGGGGPADVFGCTDPTALNYNPQATINDGSCIYGTDTGCELDNNGTPSYDANFQYAYVGDYQFVTNGHADQSIYSSVATGTWNDAFENALNAHGFNIQTPQVPLLISTPGYGQWHWFTGSNNPNFVVPQPIIGANPGSQPGITLKLSNNSASGVRYGNHVTGVYIIPPYHMWGKTFFMEITFGPNSTLSSTGKGYLGNGGAVFRVGSNVNPITLSNINYNNAISETLINNIAPSNSWTPPDGYVIGTPSSPFSILVDLSNYDPQIPTDVPYVVISLEGEEQQVLNIKQVCFIDIRDV